jgi:hypothetical protein
MRLTVERTRGAREFCAVAIATENLEARRVGVCFDPAPKSCPACAEIVCFAVSSAVAVHVIKLEEFDERRLAPRTLTVRRCASAIVSEDL